MASSDEPGTRPRRGAPLSGRLLTVATALYAVAALAAWVLVRLLGDRWPLAAPFLFGPRWIAALPLAILTPMAIVLRRGRTVGALAAIAVFVFGPLMGLTISLKGLRRDSAPRDLRLMTHNLGKVSPTSPRFLAVLDEVKPDVVTMQECMPSEDGRPLVLSGWFAHSEDQICLLSRFPIRVVDARDRKDVWDRGGSGAIVRYEIDAPGGPVDILNLHLETVREGLEGLRHGEVADMQANIEERHWESELARGWAGRAKAPLLVAGDLNMPVESAIYRRHWSDFTNAFSDAGFGYGATKSTRLIGVRIDHVLAGPGWECVSAWVGPDTGSDHRPVVADLRRRR